MIFNQLLVNGIIAGSIYSLIASGFSLIYSANRFVHFAHGTVAAAGAYMLYTLFTLWGVPFYIAAISTIIGTALLGIFIFGGIYRTLQKRKSSVIILMIASLGILILLENTLLLTFGGDVKTIGFLEVVKGTEIFGAIITPLQQVIVGVSVISFAALWIFVKYTKQGKIMRAVADNLELAKINGINTKKVQYIGFGIGSALAGLAGVLIALEQNVNPTMGTGLMLKGFTGAIIGGITSLPGAVLGSYLLGIIENFGIWYLPSGYKDAIAFVLLLLFLLVRPQGILGIKKGVRQ
ncbi:MAG: branched-chain amino acid ABC transporter permease [Candidatus Magasanikbacteria bacterium]|jgi:branched-chain amino acid transport system permease protein|nr:branched-chain amino acid ABC transporter permease [Candidatus Magasanikbacteria bacterium]MBT4350290.1 branched-chain amino acid ABC transporter permease [Candidatus Magasanikbacteria bacterium]MBT4541716.1 branched-chain amino acid ABC transporter permease [Candidatus Magasanikbacteria bacterium]MBT6253307.1 branched-chain amino acid ABC transporter permease [Candidatus Magasanikbacteria bacterium]MBT7754690.1 branched-chain amino acid ABC transporter permease [Candidatus Magasanikbacteria